MAESSIERVLIVDDEGDYRILARKYLQTLGYQCRTAVDASDALAKLAEESYQLLIADIKMPGRDGLDLTREVLQLFPHLNVIVMTGHTSDYSHSEIIGAGATDFIAKPFELDELKAKVERVARERRILSELHAVNDTLVWESAVNSSIARLSKALLNSVAVEEISELVLEHALELTGSQVGFVGYIDRESGFLVAPTMMGKVWNECRMEQKTPVFEKFGGLWGWVLKNHEPVVANHPAEDRRSCGVPKGHVGIERFLSVPAMADGTLVGQIALANAERDYTERDLKAVEQLAAIYALRVRRRWNVEDMLRAKNHLEYVFDGSAEAISFVDRHGRPIKWNQVASETFGYSEEEMRGKKIFDLYPDKDALQQMLDLLRRQGYVRRYEIEMKRKDGQIAPFLMSIRLLKNDEGETTGSVAVAMDLSDLKTTMTNLQKSNQQLQKEIAQRKHAEEELRLAQGELEKLLAERTAKLSKAGEVLKRSIDRFKSIAEE